MKVLVHKREIDRKFETLKQHIFNAVKQGQLSSYWIELIRKIEEESYERSFERSLFLSEEARCRS